MLRLQSLCFLLVGSVFMSAYGLYLDREDAPAVPFNLSPGNVNLETYYDEKYLNQNQDTAYTDGQVVPLSATMLLPGSGLVMQGQALSREQRSPNFNRLFNFGGSYNRHGQGHGGGFNRHNGGGFSRHNGGGFNRHNG